MGEVYRARDGKLRREVALKVLRKDLAKDAERLARFEREARILAQLNHPNIATLFDLEKESQQQFLAMELVLGQTLSERLHKGVMTVRECLAIARQMAEALEAAHARGVIHRDLKPSNIKITPEGRVKLLDFGLAKALETEDGIKEDSFQTASLPGQPAHKRSLLGTPAYMSPEQVDSRPADQRSDIWSLGCILYESLAGKQPFSGESIVNTLAAVIGKEPAWHLLPGDTPPRLRLLIQRCLAKDANHRPRDLVTVRRELDEVARELGGNAEQGLPMNLVRPDLPPDLYRRPSMLGDDSLTEQLTGPIGLSLDAPPARASHRDESVVRGRPARRPRRVPAWLLILMLVLALASGGAYLFWPYLWPIDSVAVLPFAVPESDAELAELAEKLVSDITKQLTEQGGMSVPTQDKVARVTDLKSLSPKQAATRLSVRGILTGRIGLENQGTILTLHAELHDTRTGRMLWEQKFSRKRVFSDADTMSQWQADIAKQIAAAAERLR
jgi:serine/threonine protein kinase/TolB-like protein